MIANRLQGGAHDLRGSGGPGKAEDGAAGSCIPKGCAQPGEGGDQVDPLCLPSAAFAIASLSSAFSSSPIPSRSHCTAAPATKMLPSRA